MAYLTIQELTRAVGGGVTPRMVRHYHASGLLPEARRSPSNYRLYSAEDVQYLRRIMTLKQQGFQLSHIRQLLQEEQGIQGNPAIALLHQQYQLILQQISRLRRTASALEGILGRDRHCQEVQAEAIAHLRQLQGSTAAELDSIEQFWESWDAATDNHPEAFDESLAQLLPDLSDRSALEVDLLSKLVLASGDVSLVDFVRVGKGAIAASQRALKAGCTIVVDLPAVAGALDLPRLAHLRCPITTLIADPHVTSAAEAETSFWQDRTSSGRWQSFPPDCILIVGYAPSILIAALNAIASQQFQPALTIGMPIGFSHAPAAKRRLRQSGLPFITLDGTLGGGFLAAVALNALAEAAIAKPHCHCYLEKS